MPAGDHRGRPDVLWEVLRRQWTLGTIPTPSLCCDRKLELFIFFTSIDFPLIFQAFSDNMPHVTSGTQTPLQNPSIKSCKLFSLNVSCDLLCGVQFHLLLKCKRWLSGLWLAFSDTSRKLKVFLSLPLPVPRSQTLELPGVGRGMSAATLVMW